MVCRYCHKTISFTRSLIDNEFCSKQHRSAFSSRSARALRDMGEITYSGADVLRDTDEFAVVKRRPAGRAAASTATALALSTLAVAGLFVLDKFGGGSADGAQKAKPESKDSTVSLLIGKALDSMPKMTDGIRLEENFDSGLRNWLPAPGTGVSSWRLENGLTRPGGLRIWDGSRNLADYSFQFQARVDQKSVGWVVRAPNHNNYYAAKLSIEGRGKSARPELVRFSMIQGQESRRQSFPLPFAIDKESFYDYEVRAVGDRIVTIVGGRVIDQWRDARFRTGGVGFFSERGEKSSIRWARLQEGESLADKLRGYLTFGIVIPIS